MEDTYFDTFGDEADGYGWEDDCYAAQWDDDPSPYDGTYSED